MPATRREGFRFGPRLWALLLAGGVCLSASSGVPASLTIHSRFENSSPPPNLAGGGSLEAIFNVAADYWERAFSDPGDAWEVELDYAWAPLGTTLGMFELDSQGGTPHRERSGRILFNNDGTLPFFADPTPLDNSEYRAYTETSADLGGGTINVGRIYSDPTGDAADRYDLLQLAEHEIGHALGMFQDNTEFQKQIPGQTLTITPPRPYAGTTIFMFSGHIDMSFLPTPLMTSIGHENERKRISGVDILAEAQLSTFNNPGLNPYAVPEPGGRTLFGLGTVGFGLCCADRKRRRRGKQARPVGPARRTEKSG